MELMQYVEDYLKENGLWMHTEDRKKAARTAKHLYCNKDYPSMETAAEDAVRSGETVRDFELKISYRSGRLTVDHCDGSDVEVCNAEPEVDEISETIQYAVEAALSRQEEECVTKKETYIVCVSPDWVRDTQVFDADSLPEGINPDTADIHDEEYAPFWYDAREPLFVRTVQAQDEEEACQIVADAKKYPMKCLYAFRP